MRDLYKSNHRKLSDFIEQYIIYFQEELCV